MTPRGPNTIDWVSEEESERLVRQAAEHMTNVPDGHTPWPVSATRKLDEEQWSL